MNSAYLDPKLARENLIASRLLNAARRQRRQQAEEFSQALEQFKRIGFSDLAAGELAEIHVYGVQQ